MSDNKYKGRYLEYNRNYQRKYRKTKAFKDKARAYKKTDKYKLYSRNLRARSREKMVNLLGGKCSKCGFLDRRALQLDHINGGGTKDRKLGKCSGSRFHKEVMRSFNANENIYQLLCANCNAIKIVESEEFRGRLS